MAGGRRRFFVGVSGAGAGSGVDSELDVVVGLAAFVVGDFVAALALVAVDFAGAFADVDPVAAPRVRVALPETAGFGTTAGDGCAAGASGAG